MRTPPLIEREPHWWPAALLWLIGVTVMDTLDGRLDLANEAMILVLVSALASLWLPPWTSVAVCALAVLAFNFAFVPPRGSFAVELNQHALLLLSMLAVGWTVALLVARQRRLAADGLRHAAQAEQLRTLGERLREVDDPRALASLLQDTLAARTAMSLPGRTKGEYRSAQHEGSAASAALMLLPAGGAARPGGEQFVGDVDADESAGLRLCASQHGAMGPGTGRHEEQPAWYLPLRGRKSSLGAALIRLEFSQPVPDGTREHAQALCDQMGLALERVEALRSAAAAREAAQTQALRNTLLAAIAHDHRTPLAAIVGAASSLHDQGERLSPAQRQRLAAAIVEEAVQLVRITDNTLQLARLDAPGLALRLDWESAEEIVGTAVRHVRQRLPAQRLHLRVEPGLPLLRCDAILLVQLLDNLIDNALKYGGEAAPVEILARRVGEQLVLAVRDRGPGVTLALREHIFEVFRRGEAAPDSSGLSRPRGAGVGLAVCRAIARAHGGELRFRPRGHGGAAFEFWLPLQAPPELPATAEAATS